MTNITESLYITHYRNQSGKVILTRSKHCCLLRNELPSVILNGTKPSFMTPYAARMTLAKGSRWCMNNNDSRG